MTVYQVRISFEVDGPAGSDTLITDIVMSALGTTGVTIGSESVSVSKLPERPVATIINFPTGKKN